MFPLCTNMTNFGETAVAGRLGYDIVFVSELVLNRVQRSIAMLFGLMRCRRGEGCVRL